ncbi:hypothetical protein Tco_0278363 [Tanacetum coccineum]
MSNNDKHIGSLSPPITTTNDLHRRPSSSTTLRHTSSLMNNDDSSSTSSRQQTILIMPSSAFINALVHIHNNPSLSNTNSLSSSSVIPTTSTTCSAPQENNDPVIGWGSIANELHVPESELLRIIERLGQLQHNRDEIISSIGALLESIDRVQPQDDVYPSCCGKHF